MKTWWGIAFGVIGGLLGAAILYLASRPPQGEAISLLPPPTPAPITIHVAGAVTHPGVYDLPRNSRVQDALQVAGGVIPGASPQSLNLAAILQDGERVLIPMLAPTRSPDDIALAPEYEAEPDQRLLIPVTSLIDINTATQAELESLPGIGPVTAQKIIAFRELNGPFASIEDILDVSGIGPVTFEKIREMITVDGG